MSTTRALASTALCHAFSSDASSPYPNLPISSSDLLRHLVIHPAHALAAGEPRLRLTDQRAFNRALHELSSSSGSWEHGVIQVASPISAEDVDGDVDILAVQLAVPEPGGRKRKREEGEDSQAAILPAHTGTLCGD